MRLSGKQLRVKDAICHSAAKPALLIDSYIRMNMICRSAALAECKYFTKFYCTPYAAK